MPPGFWNRPPGPLLRALAPLAPGRSQRAEAAGVSVPTIAVGSVSIEGGDRAPALVALVQRLTQKGVTVHVVMPAPSGAPRQVDPRAYDPAAVSDEAFVLAAFTPTWVAANPAEGVRAAAGAGAGAIVVDTGDPWALGDARLRVLVEDAVLGLGNGLAWPLGPLRRPPARACEGVDLLITIGHDAAQGRFSAAWGAALACLRLCARLAPVQTGMDWAGQPVVAFAGTRHPDRFFGVLRGLGARLVRALALTDRQDLTPTLMKRLELEAMASGAQLVTTETDAARLPEAFRQKVVSLPLRLESDDWSAAEALLGQLAPFSASAASSSAASSS